MPWSSSRPNGTKTAAKYRTPEHKRTRAAYAAQLERDGYLTCAQGRCIMRSRTILPGMAWAAGHDVTGTRYIGPVHRSCNQSDAGRQARARQRQTRVGL